MATESGLYIPAFVNEEGQSQPLATALWLDAGKNLCQQHFLKRCRAAVFQSGKVQENTNLEWRELSEGVHEGHPQEGLAAPLAALASSLYRLQPKD